MGSRTAGPEAASEGSGRYHRAEAGSRSHPLRRKKGAGKQGEGRGEGQTPQPRRAGGALTQQQPPGARRAQERGEHPCGAAPAPRSAHCGAHCAPRRLCPARPAPPRPARSPPLPRRRAVFLAALLLSPSSRALQIPPKRGYAAGGARMLIRTSLPAGIHERRRGKRGGETYSFIALFSPLADEIAAGR